MTENEYKHLRYLVFSQEPYDHKEEQAIIKIFEEIQLYRAIGTIEEFKDLKEKEERFDRNIKMFNKIGLEIRNKAIDELKNKICMHFADWKFSEDDKVIKDIIELASESVDEIAEEMRGAKHEKN